MQQLRAPEKVSIVCGFLFTLLVRDRTPENIIMEKEWKNWTQSWKITAFRRWKWPMECETRDSYCADGEADLALYGVFCNNSNRWLRCVRRGDFYSTVICVCSSSRRALAQCRRARKTFIMLFQFSQWDESQSRLAAVGAHLTGGVRVSIIPAEWEKPPPRLPRHFVILLLCPYSYTASSTVTPARVECYASTQ